MPPATRRFRRRARVVAVSAGCVQKASGNAMARAAKGQQYHSGACPTGFYEQLSFPDELDHRPTSRSTRILTLKAVDAPDWADTNQRNEYRSERVMTSRIPGERRHCTFSPVWG